METRPSDSPARTARKTASPGTALLLGVVLAVGILAAELRTGEAQTGSFGTQVVVAPSSGGGNQSNPSIALDASGVA